MTLTDSFVRGLPGSCGCGKVQLRINGSPLFRFECYCHSCADAVKFCTEKGANDGVPDFLDGNGRFTNVGPSELGVDLFMVVGKQFEVIEGESLIVPYKLNESTKTVRFYSKCCGSNLGEHGDAAFALPVTLFQEKNEDDQLPALDGRVMIQKDEALALELSEAEPKVPQADTFPTSIMCKLLNGFCFWSYCCCCPLGDGPAPYNVKSDTNMEIAPSRVVVEIERT
jgi:hypothetical protein